MDRTVNTELVGLEAHVTFIATLTTIVGMEAVAAPMESAIMILQLQPSQIRAKTITSTRM
jgi:hypothetical protein